MRTWIRGSIVALTRRPAPEMSRARAWRIRSSDSGPPRRARLHSGKVAFHASTAGSAPDRRRSNATSASGLSVARWRTRSQAVAYRDDSLVPPQAISSRTVACRWYLSPPAIQSCGVLPTARVPSAAVLATEDRYVARPSANHLGWRGMACKDTRCAISCAIMTSCSSWESSPATRSRCRPSSSCMAWPTYLGVPVKSISSSGVARATTSIRSGVPVGARSRACASSARVSSSSRIMLSASLAPRSVRRTTCSDVSSLHSGPPCAGHTKRMWVAQPAPESAVARARRRAAAAPGRAKDVLNSYSHASSGPRQDTAALVPADRGAL